MGESGRAKLKQSWFVISTLVSKDFAIKYRRSILGVLWSVLNPLLMMLVLTAVFSTIFRFEIEHYPFYLILGNTLFNLGMDTAGSSMHSILASASLIKKVKVDLSDRRGHRDGGFAYPLDVQYPAPSLVARLYEPFQLGTGIDLVGIGCVLQRCAAHLGSGEDGVDVRHSALLSR